MAKLRGKKPEDRPQRLKLLLSGPAGYGKTTAAIQMPKPYIIDTEGGSVHYGDIIDAKGGAVFETQDMSEILGEIRSLITEQHDYQTLVIDPITTAYHILGDEGERLLGTEFQRHYKMYADKFMRRLMNLISVVDMNVVVTAHSKAKWGEYIDEKGKKQKGVVGETFDGYAKLDYQFDLWIRLERDEATRKRYGVVEKTRLKPFPDLDRFEWSYEVISKRWGKDRLETGASTIQMADAEKVAQFQAMFDRLKEDEIKALKLDKALTKYGDPEDWTAEQIDKAIELIKEATKVAA